MKLSLLILSQKLISLYQKRTLRGNAKAKFMLMTKCTGKYLKSPLYKGSTLWDILSPGIQRSETVTVLKKNVIRMNHEYVNLL